MVATGRLSGQNEMDKVELTRLCLLTLEQANTYSTLCLSDLLQMDESLSSTMLTAAQSQLSEFGRRTPLVTALALFHLERAAWIESIILLIQGYLNDRVPMESRRLFGYMLRNLFGSDRTQPNALLKTLLESIDHLSSYSSKLPSLIDGQAPNLPPHPAQTLLSAIGGTSTLEEHTSFIEEQSRRLKYTVCLLAHRTPISSKDTLLLLKRLQSSTEANEDFSFSALLSSLMRQSPESGEEGMSSEREFLLEGTKAVDGEWKGQGMRLGVRMGWGTYLKGFQPVGFLM